MSTSKIIELDASNTCQLCDNALAKYSCPKCQTKYCSLTCYQSEAHLQCSEDFYKSCIVEELSLENNDESKRKMLEILQRERIAADADDEALDSDDDDSIADIAERLAGVDLDNADQVWENLTEDEQQAFVAFLKSEDVSKLIASWTPWWAHQAKDVEEVESCAQFKHACPALIHIQDFKKISTRPPADCVKFNLVNTMAAYAFTARYFNGEHHDFSKEAVTCIVTVSLVFKNNHNFESHETALKSVQASCLESDWIVADAENFKLLSEDVDKIIRGPSQAERNFYVLCALSDLHKLLEAALKAKPASSSKFSKTFPNDHFPDVKLESRGKIKTCLRKVDYFLSFAKDCYHL